MFSILVPMLNAILVMLGFILLMHIASMTCRRFLLLFLLTVFVSLTRIFRISEEVIFSVSLLYFVIRCFIALASEKWYVGRRESVVVVWLMKVLIFKKTRRLERLHTKIIWKNILRSITKLV